MVTFTKLKKSETYNAEFLAEVKRLGAFNDPVNGPGWAAVTSALGRDLLGQYVIYEKESKDYFNWLDKQFPIAKALTAEAIKIATALGTQWSDSEFARLKLKKEAMDALVEEINAHRKEHVNHQGFRGTFGFKVSAGGPPRLEMIETEVLTKRKVYIDKGVEVGPAVDKLRNEYQARVNTAVELAAKYKAAGEKKIITAHTDLEELAKIVTAWLNPKSDRYTEINGAMTNLERDFAELEKLKKPTSQKDFDARKPNYTLLSGKIAVAKTKLNTEHKKLEILQGVLGPAMLDKKVLDQNLVKTVIKGFSDAKAKFKTLDADMIKDYKARVEKIEKKVVK